MGFFELVVIGIIALVVFGPEKLPKVIYDVGQTWRSLRRSATNMRNEFEQAMTADLKADMHNKAVLDALEENNINASNSLDQIHGELDDLPYKLDTSPSQDTDKSQ